MCNEKLSQLVVTVFISHALFRCSKSPIQIVMGDKNLAAFESHVKET
jgi:hypothetical protein